MAVNLNIYNETKELINLDSLKEKGIIRIVAKQMTPAKVPMLDMQLECGVMFDSQHVCWVDVPVIKKLGVSAEDVLKICMKSMQENYPVELRRTSLPGISKNCLLVSNTEYIYGSTALLYKDVSKWAAEIMGDDFIFSFPSVHEALLVPASDMQGVEKRAELEKAMMNCGIRLEPKDRITSLAYKFIASENTIYSESRPNSLKSFSIDSIYSGILPEKEVSLGTDKVKQFENHIKRDFQMQL